VVADVDDSPDAAVELVDGADSGAAAEPVELVDADEDEFDVWAPSSEVEPPVVDESEDDDAESEVSATATAGVVATAAPMPSATASAPTRPTYLA
jgi:hypothetical protein